MVRYLAVLLCLLATPVWAQSFPGVNARLGEKLFVGDAALKYPNTGGPFLGNTCASGDWFSTFEGTTLPNGTCGYTGIFQVVVESDANISSATGGILGAAQSKNAGSNQGSIGVMGFGLNNGSANTFPTWGGYFECDETIARAGCTGVEIDVGNMTNDSGAGSPDAFTQGALPALQLACGSGLSSPTMFKCSAAVQVVNNANAFKVGISFLNSSIVSGSFFGGSAAPAIVMPENYGIIWYSAAGTPAAGIVVDGTGNVNIIGNKLVFNGTQVTVP